VAFFLGRNFRRPSVFLLLEMKMNYLVTISILAASLQVAPVVLGQDNDAPGKGNHGQRWQQRLANLSPDERQKLQTAHQKAMQDPGVQAAKNRMRAAHREFRDAMRAAMIKADPSVQSILEKLPQRQRDS
jgi:Spy/CpxP family protein refolding chaperone